jgi:hypothetical protein
MAFLAVLFTGSSAAVACDCAADYPNDFEGGIIGIGRILDSFAVQDVRSGTVHVFVLDQADFDRVSCMLETNGGPQRVDVADTELSFLVYGKTASGKLRGYERGTKRRIYFVSGR